MRNRSVCTSRSLWAIALILLPGILAITWQPPTASAAGQTASQDTVADCVEETPRAAPGCTLETFASGLDGPVGLAFTPAGDLLVANEGQGETYPGSEVSSIDPEGNLSQAADGLSGPSGIDVSPQGEVFVSDDAAGVYRIVDGAPVLVAEVQGNPNAIRFGPSGNLYVAPIGTDSVLAVTPDGTVSTFVSGITAPAGLAFDEAGDLYVSSIQDGTIARIGPDGSVIDGRFAAGLRQPEGLAFDPERQVLYAVSHTGLPGGRIYEIDMSGQTTVLAYDFQDPRRIAVSATGDLYISSFGREDCRTDRIWRLRRGAEPSGQISGHVRLPESYADLSVPPSAKGVRLYSRDPRGLGPEAHDEALVWRGHLGEDWTFRLPRLADGSYYVRAHVSLVIDGEEADWVGFSNLQEDGRIAPVVIQGGEPVPDVAVTLYPPGEVPMPAPPEEPARLAVSLAGVPLEAGGHNPFLPAGPDPVLQLTFSPPLDPQAAAAGSEGLQIVAYPEGLAGLMAGALSDSGRVYTTTVALPQDTAFQLRVTIDGSVHGVPGGGEFFLSTGEMPAATVSGSVVLPEGVPASALQWRSVNLLDRLPDGDGGEAGGTGTVRHVPYQDTETFSFRHVPAGTYYVQGFAGITVDGQEQDLSGIFDPGGDGTPDPIAVAEGDTVTAIAVSLYAPGEGPEPPPPAQEPVIQGPAGPIALDLDIAAGDQAVRSRAVRPGEDLTVDIVALSGADGQTGFQARLGYDPAHLSWSGFTPAGLFAAGAPIVPEPGEGVVLISLALLGGTASGDAGTLGHATFQVLDGFTGETTVSLLEASFDQAVQVGSEGATVTLTLSDEATPDFNNDGAVDFNDFIQFARSYGTRQGQIGYHPKFDLNGNGEIGFQDFIQFAQAYGAPAQ